MHCDIRITEKKMVLTNCKVFFQHVSEAMQKNQKRNLGYDKSTLSLGPGPETRAPGIQSQFGRLVEETYSYPLSGKEIIFLSRPAIFVVSNPNELDRLLHCMWIVDKCRGALIGRETGGGGLNWRYKFKFNFKNYIIKITLQMQL